MELQPHLQRVVDEKIELDEKLSKLLTFFSTPIFQSLKYSEQRLLSEQHAAMSTYSDILKARISSF